MTENLRRLGHDVRGFVQDVMTSCYLISHSQCPSKKIAETLLEKSRKFKDEFNVSLEKIKEKEDPGFDELPIC